MNTPISGFKGNVKTESIKTTTVVGRIGLWKEGVDKNSKDYFKGSIEVDGKKYNLKVFHSPSAGTPASSGKGTKPDMFGQIESVEYNMKKL